MGGCRLGGGGGWRQGACCSAASGGEPELQLLLRQLRRAMVLPFLRRLGAVLGVLRACSMLSIAWYVVARRVRSQKRIAEATWIVWRESSIVATCTFSLGIFSRAVFEVGAGVSTSWR